MILFTLFSAARALFFADKRRLAIFGARAVYAADLNVSVSSGMTPGPNGSVSSPLAPSSHC
jgi:hypothetical protein